MIRHQVPAAFPAILTLAEFSPLERRDVLGSQCDPHRLRLPQAEGVYRPARPRATRTAMTIAHRFRCPRHLQFYCAAKAASKVRQWLPPSSSFVIAASAKVHSDITLTNKLARRISRSESNESIAAPRECPVINGPEGPKFQLPLYSRKRTSPARPAMSEKCHKRTHATQQNSISIRLPHQRWQSASTARLCRAPWRP
jgi:hypothetical protein